MVIYAAPLQGYTTALWRRAHAGLCGGIDAYFTSFVRIESGKPAHVHYEMPPRTAPPYRKLYSATSPSCALSATALPMPDTRL